MNGYKAAPIATEQALGNFGGGRVRYQNGIIFAGPTADKGKVLSKFLSTYEIPFSRIVFFDNELKNNRAVDKSLVQKGFESYSVHYTPFGGGIMDRVFCRSISEL